MKWERFVLLVGGLALVIAGLVRFIIDWQLPDPLSVVNIGFILGILAILTNGKRES